MHVTPQCIEIKQYLSDINKGLAKVSAEG